MLGGWTRAILLEYLLSFCHKAEQGASLGLVGLVKQKMGITFPKGLWHWQLLKEKNRV